MKQIYDGKHQDKEFQLGEWVNIHLQPYRQQTVARKINMKLAPKFYGPYKILAWVGKMAYKVDLLANSCIHLVFHVSLLKQKVGSKKYKTTLLPLTTKIVRTLLGEEKETLARTRRPSRLEILRETEVECVEVQRCQWSQSLRVKWTQNGERLSLKRKMGLGCCCAFWRKLVMLCVLMTWRLLEGQNTPFHPSLQRGILLQFYFIHLSTYDYFICLLFFLHTTTVM